MEVIDVHGKSILEGSYVRYTGTGTTGEVSEVKIENHETWAKLKDEKLWYNSEYLEVIEKPEELDRAKKMRKEDLREKVKKTKRDFEDVDISSELCDGGG